MGYRIWTSWLCVVGALVVLGCDDESAAPGTGGGAAAGGGSSTGGNATGGNATGGGTTETAIIPADRRIVWEGNVGIPGGIPQRDTVCATIDAALGDGNADATSAIQSALDSCPDDQVVVVPAGTFRITSTVQVRSHRVLRGAGPDETVISFEGPLDGRTGIALSGNPGLIGSTSSVAITGGSTKGSTTITVSSTAGAEVGAVMLIDQLNDGDLIDPEGVEGKCTYCGREDGDRTLGQLVEITAIDGNDISFNIPLYWSYDLAQSAEATFADPDGYILWAGVEDLTLTQPEVSARYLIEMQATQYCWLKNVEVERVDWRAVWMQQCLQCEVRESYFHESINGYGRSHGYGVLLTTFSSANLIENNILRTLDGGFIQTSGASGNVMAYNYFEDSRFDDEWWLTGSPSINHAPHPIMNLWEGNIGYQVVGDFIHGSASHNTVYRSRSMGWQREVTTANNNAVAFGKKNTSMNVVGCVLGTEGRSTRYEALPGQAYDVSSEVTIWALGVMHPDADDPNVAATLLRHGNYDYVNHDTIWAESIDEHTLPASLYLSAKPAWFGDAPWPPIGPDVDGLSQKIPAQLRFEALANP